MEKSHGELQAEHYEAVKTNPMYRLEGMMDVLREELMMNMPSLEPKLEVRGTAPLLEEPPWTKRQWDVVNQLRNEVRGWRKQHYELLKEMEGMRTTAGKKEKPTGTIPL